MPAKPRRPTEQPKPSRVDEFAQSVHASYLSRWLSHDPDALQKVGKEAAAERRRKQRRTSAA